MLCKIAWDMCARQDGNFQLREVLQGQKLVSVASFHYGVSFLHGLEQNRPLTITFLQRMSVCILFETLRSGLGISITLP